MVTDLIHLALRHHDAPKMHRPTHPCSPAHAQLPLLEAGIDPIDVNIHPTVTRYDEIRILELEGAGKGVDVFVEILIDRFLERVNTGLGVVVPDLFGWRDRG